MTGLKTFIKPKTLVALIVNLSPHLGRALPTQITFVNTTFNDLVLGLRDALSSSDAERLTTTDLLPADLSFFSAHA